MIDVKVYGVTENVAEKSRLPKIKIEIDGKKKKVSKVPYFPRTLTLDELNYTLNDALQNEFDRSIAVMIALAAIGTLRHSEVMGLQVGKVRLYILLIYWYNYINLERRCELWLEKS